MLCSCPVWVPFRGRTNGLFEEDVTVGPVHGQPPRALLILALEALRSLRRGFDLVRLILWYYLDCMYMGMGKKTYEGILSCAAIRTKVSRTKVSQAIVRFSLFL